MSNKKLSDKIKNLAKAVQFHDLAYGDALADPANPMKIKDGTPKIGDHKRLWEIVEALDQISQELDDNMDWADIKMQFWDPITFKQYVRPDICRDITSEGGVRVIELPDILAESDFDELMEDFKAKHALTYIYGD